MASENFKAKDFGVRVQKKLLSHMSNKVTLKLFIDDSMAAILDNTYRLFKLYTGNKKEAEKLMKSIIKTIIKIGILHRNGKFVGDELQMASSLRLTFQKTLMTIASFCELEFSYDHNHLTRLLDNVHVNVTSLVRNHLTNKSLNRIDQVFHFCKQKEFCDKVFQKDSLYRQIVDCIIIDLNKILEPNR